MAQTGRLVKNRTEITKINGHLFQLRMNVNLVSNVLGELLYLYKKESIHLMMDMFRHTGNFLVRTSITTHVCRNSRQVTTFFLDSMQ